VRYKQNTHKKHWFFSKNLKYFANISTSFDSIDVLWLQIDSPWQGLWFYIFHEKIPMVYFFFFLCIAYILLGSYPNNVMRLWIYSPWQGLQLRFFSHGPIVVLCAFIVNYSEKVQSHFKALKRFSLIRIMLKVGLGFRIDK
jgi:hypothetical protein